MKIVGTLVTLTIAFAAGMFLSQRNMNTATSSDRFAGLGDLSGGKFFSIAKSVSADGSVVVGYSNSAEGMEAFRWTRSDGMMGLEFPEASSVSSDGSVIVGHRLHGGRVEPVRWTLRDGTKSLGAQAIRGSGAAHGVSADGSMIVGVVGAEQTDLGERDAAFQWTRQRGIEHLEKRNAAAIWSEAHAVSADGTVVVGARRHRTGHNEAFRWTAESGAVGLGVLPGYSISIAYGVSADGSVVVGSCSDYITTEAFRWTKKSGMVSLGKLPGGKRGSTAHGVSADGSVIVGNSNGANGTEAFVWDEAHGMRSIYQVLVREFHLGDALQGWKLRSAMAVSADGSIVVGYGLNRSGDREAWMARLNGEHSTLGPLPVIGGQLTAGRRQMRGHW